MNGKLTDISSYRARKALKGDRKVGVEDAFELRRPEAGQERSESLSSLLSEEHSRNRGAQLPMGIDPSVDDDNGFSPAASQALAERIERLKSSISRINALMDELRMPAHPYGTPEKP